MTHSSLLPRRGFLAATAALALAGCGFQLRKAPDFAFKSIAVPGKSAFVNMVRRNLAAQGTVRVVPPTEAPETAEVICDILGEDRDRAIVASNAAGQVTELTLGLRVRFRLRTPDGKEVLPSTEISQSRDISFNESSALAKENEEVLLYRDMQTDIAQQMLRRLAAIRSL